MALTDLAIRAAKPREKPYKMGDAFGLFFSSSRAARASGASNIESNWREKKLGLGMYPLISLADARKRRDDARRLIAEGRDPSLEKQRERLRSELESGNTFSAISAEYYAK